MIDRLAGFQLQCLRKDAEIVAASTAAAVAVAASAAAAAPAGQGGSHWGQSTGRITPSNPLMTALALWGQNTWE